MTVLRLPIFLLAILFFQIALLMAISNMTRVKSSSPSRGINSFSLSSDSR